ncbi:N-acyl homoserine lactone autoinducer synthase [Candidatus Burkholderia humilis]|nr:N-acyl homoserine lactone autoinducer synthase [Candidatus Burkholderia humilis]
MSIDANGWELLQAYRIRLASSKDDLQQIFRLRHQVFAEELRWVPQVNSGLEQDQYDTRAMLIGIFDSNGSAVGTIRLLFKPGIFMLEREFAIFLPDCPTGKTAPAEMTRLCVDPRIRRSGLGRQISQALFCAAYLACLSRDVHEADFVSTPAFVHSLLERGFPCAPFGNTKTLCGEVKSVAARMYWDRLDAFEVFGSRVLKP